MRSIGIPARNLLKNRQRVRRLPTCTATALSSAPRSNSATVFMKQVPVTRYFSTSQIESHSLTEPSSETERALTAASTAIEKFCQNDATQEAEKILRTMEEQGLCLDSSDYVKVLKCYIRLNQVDRAHRLLLTMKQTPCRDCFPLVASALIEENKLSQAKEILYNHMDRGIATTLSFNTMISAYIHQNRQRQAVALVHKMDWYARKGHPEARPDRLTMTTIMQKLASRGHSRDARALLERMWTSPDRAMRPDAVTYSLVFNAYANAQNCDPDDAYELLQIMNDRFKEHGELSMRPNTVVYNSFLSVLAHAGDGERAELVLKEMEHATDLRPDVISYGTVLTAWKNASRGDKAEVLLWRIPSPDRLCFSMTIAALAKQGEAKRAEAILRHMISTNMDAERDTFTSVLNAWSIAKDDPDAFENAKRILREMGERGFVIDTPVYNTFLKAIENSFMLDNKVHAVSSVLQRMRSTNSQPNNATCRQAISAVAASHGDASVQRKALSFAMQIFQDRKNLSPREQTDTRLHACMLEACGKLSPHGMYGDEIVEEVFLTCCQEGIVTSLHTRLLQKAASDNLLKKIFNVDTIDQKMFRSLPKSWSRNRRGKRKQGGNKR